MYEAQYHDQSTIFNLAAIHGIIKYGGILLFETTCIITLNSFAAVVGWQINRRLK